MKKHLITNFKLFKRTLFFSTLSVFRIEIHLKKKGGRRNHFIQRKKKRKGKINTYGIVTCKFDKETKGSRRLEERKEDWTGRREILSFPLQVTNPRR